MNRIKIIMFDSGIGEYQADFCKDIKDKKDKESYVDRIGHGCAVFHILNKAGVSVESRKIMFSDEMEEEILLDEFRKLSYEDHLEGTIVNLSMGITSCRNKIEFFNICKNLTEKGCIIVSAFDNDGAISYPAAFSCVVGVDTSRNCRKITEYEYVEDNLVNIRGFGGVQVLPSLDGERAKYIGSSFVAPHISVLIAELLMIEQLNVDQVLERLKENAVKVYENSGYKQVVQKKPRLHKAIVFPLNKEIINLLRYPELLSFEIQNIFDFHHMRSVGKKVSEIVGKDVYGDYKVENIRNIDWEDDFDSIIMGHMHEINQTLHYDFIKSFLDCARQYKKRVYAFDDLSVYKEEMKELEIFYPHISSENVPQNRFGKQYQIACPIVGVFGTSSKQGKFTLQLELRKRFLKDEFKVAQLSTEPNGLLYGMDAVYPMGYDGKIEIESYDEISVINDILNQIVKDDTDLLLIGSQSQTVAYSSQNLSLFPISNANLLLASFPDIIILCVNYYDDIEYITRTIHYLEGIVDTHVLALVLSPFQQEYSGSSMVRNSYTIDNERLIARRKEMEKIFQLNVFFINQKDMDELYRLCIEILT